MKSRSEKVLWIVLALVLLGTLTAKVSWRLSDLPEKRATKQGQLVHTSQARLAQDYGKLPLSFELNKGQTDSQVKFLSRSRGYTMFLTQSEAVLALRSQKSGVRSQWENTTDNRPRIADALFPPLIQNPKSQIQNPPAPSTQPQAPDVVRLKLVGANANAKVVGLEPLPGKSNYFIGNDPKEWRTNVPTYAKVKYKGVYPGIDLIYYGNQGRLEYDFVVAPGGDPRTIALNIDGAEKMQIDPQGDLVLSSDGGDVRLHKPVVYQVQPTVDSRQSKATDNGRRTTDDANPKSKITNPKSIDGRYVLLADNRVGFEVANYDKTKPLIIDPVLSYSTFLGGSGDDYAYGMAVDAAGNAYVTGYTSSINFPTFPGAFQTSLGGTYDAFITKLNAAGSALVYSTYLGGSNDDYAYGIAVDAAGIASVAGYTLSSDFPTTPGAFQPIFGGSYDAFVTKLSADGSTRIYSTYLGGSAADYAKGIAVDASGNAYVTGITSSDFPTTPGAFQTNGRGYYDAFVVKLEVDGSALVYSTYLGGSTGYDQGFGIAVDASGSAYVTGATSSIDFPTSPEAFQPSFGGGDWYWGVAFVAKLNAAGSALVYSTYLGGGSSYDYANGIAVDAAGNAYVTGLTCNSNFPTTPGAFQTIYGDGGDAFVTKLNAAGSALVYSTFLGGRWDDYGYRIAVDASGNTYVAGVSSSSYDFPTTPGGFQYIYQFTAFVTKLNVAGSALVYSTFLGEMTRDQGIGLAVDATGDAYVAGYTGAFPTTPGAFQTSYGGGNKDAFVAKISPDVSLTPTSLTFASQTMGMTSSPQTVTLRNLRSEPLTIGSIVASGDFEQTNTCTGGIAEGSSCTIDVTFTPTATGTRDGTLTVTDDAPSSPQTVSLRGVGTNPVPFLTTLSPSSATAGGAAFTLTVNGSDFVNGSVVRWNGSDRATTYVSSTQLTASINAADIATTGTVAVTVLDATPVGGLSFEILKPPYAAQVQPPINADGSSVFKANRGVVPVKFTLTSNGAQTCQLPPATISLGRIAGTVVGSIAESAYLMPSDNSSNFRIGADCQYIYNLGAGSLGKGTYQVNIAIEGAIVGSGVFGLN